MKSTGGLAARAALFLTGWTLLALAVLLPGAPFAGKTAPAQFVRELALFGAVFLLSALFCRWDRERLPAARPGDGLLLGGGTGVLLAGGVLLIFWTGGMMSFRSQLAGLDGLWLWLLALACRAARVALLCCGYLFTLLEKRFGPAAAALGSAALHLLLCTGFWEDGWTAAANGLAVGLLLGLLRLRSGGLSAPAAADFLWTFAAGFVFNGLPLDGYPHLTTVRFEGPVLLSGGESGMNGSLVTLGVALLCCGVLTGGMAHVKMRLYRRGKRPNGGESP